MATSCLSLARKPAGVRASSRRRRGPSRKRAQRAVPTRSAAGETRYGELVLVASDDAEVRCVLCDELDDHGYRTIIAGSSTPVDELAAQVMPILILFDLDRNDGNGLALLARIRERTARPVIALSERASEGDKVTALDAGADDYVTKPFGRLELFARIRVALRYVRARPAGEDKLEVGPIQIDAARYLVTVAGKPVHLTPIEFRILSVLARFRGAVVTRDQLVHEVWGPESDQADHVRVHIAALRRKIEQDPQRPRRLLTVMSIGYRLGD
jgi:two-component system, OmpR family, KDP operon response regulator KdpE